MKNQNKKNPVKRKYVKKAAKAINDAHLKPFEVEVNPPHYRLNPDLAVTLQRIDLTVKTLSPGNAFIVPAKSRAAIKTYMTEKWPYSVFRFASIKDNPSVMRVYFLKQLDRK